MPEEGICTIKQQDYLTFDEIYQETAWSMELRAGGKMKHKARRITG